LSQATINTKPRAPTLKEITEERPQTIAKYKRLKVLPKVPNGELFELDDEIKYFDKVIMETIDDSIRF